MYTNTNLGESKNILQKYMTEYDRENINVEKSLAEMVSHFGDEQNCSKMKRERVESFLGVDS